MEVACETEPAEGTDGEGDSAVVAPELRADLWREAGIPADRLELEKWCKLARGLQEKDKTTLGHGWPVIETGCPMPPKTTTATS